VINFAAKNSQMAEAADFTGTVPIGMPTYVLFTLGDNTLFGASVKSLCSMTMTSSGNYGDLELDNFGFGYIDTIDGQQIAKSEFGSKPLLIKCNAPGGYS
jgi:hypothetical protein